MKVEIPLTNLIIYTYNCLVEAQDEKDKHLKVLNNRETTSIDEDEGYYEGFEHGRAVGGVIETTNSVNHYKFILKNLLNSHDIWNSIDPEVEKIKLKLEEE